MSEFLALPGFIVGVLGAITAIIAALLTLYVHRREHPRREFSWEVSYSPLVTKRAQGLPKLAVTYDGDDVPHPHLVTVEIASTGRADISSSSFDGNRPVIFDLGVPVLDEIDQTLSTSTVSARLHFTPNQSDIKLAPSLLPKQFTARATYLCAGEPACKPKIELSDIATREGIRPKKEPRSQLEAWELRAKWSIAVCVVVFLTIATINVIDAWVKYNP